MVDFLQHGLSYHVAQELNNSARSSSSEAVSVPECLERAFLMADIHAKHAGVILSGATVSVCLIQVRAAGAIFCVLFCIAFLALRLCSLKKLCSIVAAEFHVSTKSL
jgi:hypothetical protein